MSSFATNFPRSLSTTMSNNMNGMLWGGTNGIVEAYANYANAGNTSTNPPSMGIDWITNTQWPSIYYPVGFDNY